MLTPSERYIVDAQGRPTEVVLSLEDYHRILDELEELESLRAFDAAKASKDEAISLEQALSEIDQNR